MNKRILILPGLTLIGGIILRIVDFVTAFVLIKGNGTSEWTLEMGTIAFYVRLVMSVIVFAVIGIILRRIYDRRTFVKSATLLVIYSIIVFALEQNIQYFWAHMIIYWMYLPWEMFAIITSLLAKISREKTINWIYAIPSLFAPYLFVLFSKKAKD